MSPVPTECFWRNTFSVNYWSNQGLACEFIAPLHLPTGALVTNMIVVYRDSSASEGVQVRIHRFRQSPDGTRNDDTVYADWSSTGTPGLDTVNVDLDDFTIGYYFIFGGDTMSWAVGVRTALDNTTGIRGVIVVWKRQVSPAPSVATFTDVPTTSPFFQYVEALYDTGIIAGCGGGNYCPTNPVTRGQMAVYMAKLLGLHYNP